MDPLVYDAMETTNPYLPVEIILEIRTCSDTFLFKFRRMGGAGTLQRRDTRETPHWLKESEVNVEILCLRSGATGCLHLLLE